MDYVETLSTLVSKKCLGLCVNKEKSKIQVTMYFNNVGNLCL